jgi:GTPase
MSEIRRQRHNKIDSTATERIAPEDDDGHIEYKLKMLHSNAHRIEQLTTQMRYRVNEGNGECIYVMGVTDSGGLIGITEDEYTQSRELLDHVAEKNSYTVTLLTEQKVDSALHHNNFDDTSEKKVYEFLVRERNSTKYVDVKVAVAGNVDSGKSSLLGVLLTGHNDNGRGSARLNVFNYAHEVKSGRTSSVAQHILGFDDKGSIVNHDESLGRKKTWPDIVKNSSKVVTFFDLCGHERYLKTTILGLTSQFPDLALILVGANMGVTKMTKEHVFLCLTLRIPFAIVITKVDLCTGTGTCHRPQVLKDTVKGTKKLLKVPGLRRIPCDIRCDEDVIIAAKNIGTFSTAPIFYASNVTGEGIDHIRLFLNLYNRKAKEEKNENKVEYHVEQTFQVQGVGTVVGGQLINGTIRVGDKLILGPNNNTYKTVQVKSIHCKRVSVDEVEHGSYVCLALRKMPRDVIKRGNVIMSTIDTAVQCMEFEAEISVLKSHSTTIKVGYEPVVHTCSVRQTAQILSITKKVCAREGKEDDGILRTGDRALVRFKWCYHPEYIKEGFRLLLAEGRVKVIGKVKNVFNEPVRVE